MARDLEDRQNNGSNQNAEKEDGDKVGVEFVHGVIIFLFE